MEEWREVEGTEGRILVSNEGRLMSKLRNKDGNIIKPTPDQKGYLRIKITLDGVSKSYKVHRMVASAFIPNPNNLPQVNHIDGIKTNNNVSNLEWISNIENCHHAIEHGLWNSVSLGAIKENEKRKRRIIATKGGDTIHFSSISEAERVIGTKHINAVIKGKRSHAKGWHFAYESEVI